MSLTFANATRAAHSCFSNSSVSDICESTTKIVDTTLTTYDIINYNFDQK